MSAPDKKPYWVEFAEDAPRNLGGKHYFTTSYERACFIEREEALGSVPVVAMGGATAARIYREDFDYAPSAATDVRKTFAKERKRLAALKKESAGARVTAIVRKERT